MKTYTQIPIMMMSLLVVGTLSACGGSSGSSFSLLADANNFKQDSATSFNNQLDILWVVDNSGSMGPFQNNLTANFNSFISNFATKGYDFRMAVTTSDAYRANAAFQNNPALAKFRDGVTQHSKIFTILPSTPSLETVFVTNATQGENGSGDERVFSSLRETLSSPLNAGFVRPSSFVSVIIISDEDDFSSAKRPEYSWLSSGGVSDHNYNYAGLDTVQSYVDYLDTITGTTGAARRYNVSAITVKDAACLNSHIQQSSTTIIGQRYIQLAAATNGVTGSICDSSFANTLNLIQQQISSLSTKFHLSRLPVVSTIVVTVNGAIVPEGTINGWVYDATTNSIVFHGSATPPQGANIAVAFNPQQYGS